METLELLAMCYKAQGAYTLYNNTANKILKIDPNNPSVNIQKANDYVLSKRWKLARNYYGNALKGDSENLEAMFGYAKMSYYMGDLNTAERYLEKILEKDPENAEALAYMGTISFDKEDYISASEYIQFAIKLDPSNYNYWIDYGTYLRYQGKFDEAEQAWKKAVEIDPTYFLAYEYLAGNYDDQGKYDEALANYHKVIETNPNYFYAYETIAILEYHAKNYKEAIKYFQKAYECNDSYSYTLMTAACYFKLKDQFNAKKVLAAEMKKHDRSTTEYDLLRFFHDSYSRNAESSLLRKINAETNSNTRGKMLFYMGLYNEINGSDVLANEFYSQVTSLQAPMFFEYRIAEWGLLE